MPKNKSQLKQHATKVNAILAKTYPDAECALRHQNALQLLIATILSAQCTDVRVNIVTKDLFAKYKNAKAFAAAQLEDLEQEIRSTGFYRNKAKSVKNACTTIVEKFGGKVPETMEELLTLAGVARKTANVVLGTAFGKNEGVVVDTHVTRLSNRLGLTTHNDPVKIERDLMQLIPQKDWTIFAHRMIQHGRKICIARKPRCGECPLEKICPAAHQF